MGPPELGFVPVPAMNCLYKRFRSGWAFARTATVSPIFTFHLHIDGNIIGLQKQTLQVRNSHAKSKCRQLKLTPSKHFLYLSNDLPPSLTAELGLKSW